MFQGILKQSTARNAVVLMIDSADHITGKASLTLTITASKDGGAFASITPTVTDLGSGLYNLALTTTHTNTLGDFTVHITSTGADPSDYKFQVTTELPGIIATNSDKTGYALTSAEHILVGNDVQTGLTAQGYTTTRAGYIDTLNGIVQAVWDKAVLGITAVGSIGKLLITQLDAAISTRSTYAGADTSGTTTLLGRLTAGRSINLDNLDTTVSSRSTYAGGAVASVTAGVTVTTNNDKTGYALTAGEHTNVVADVNTAFDSSNAELTAFPGSPTSLRKMIQFVYQMFGFKRTITSTTEKLFKSDSSTQLATSTLSDDGTTFTATKKV